LLCPEAHITAFLRAALKSARDNETVITNVLTGRPARVFMVRIVRELGPLATGVPSFPIPGYDLYPLSAKAQSLGSADFSGLYAGQGAALAQELPAGELTAKLATSALEHLGCA
jgi:nitronate monooxygenase